MYNTHTNITTPATLVGEATVVLNVHGPLNGSSYRELLETARDNHWNGARRMIVNMADVDSVSSAGIAGLYLIGELLEGRATYDQDPEGWVVYDQMHEALEQGRAFTRLFLAAPNERVASTLRVTQFDRLARTLPSVEDAISLLA